MKRFLESGKNFFVYWSVCEDFKYQPPLVHWSIGYQPPAKSLGKIKRRVKSKELGVAATPWFVVRWDTVALTLQWVNRKRLPSPKFDIHATREEQTRCFIKQAAYLQLLNVKSKHVNFLSLSRKLLRLRNFQITENIFFFLGNKNQSPWTKLKVNLCHFWKISDASFAKSNVTLSVAFTGKKTATRSKS